MGRISLKALIRAVFYVSGVIALSGCIIEPVNITVFVQDDDVIEIIDRGGPGKVIKASGSDADLIPGNGKISGLNPNKYYMIVDLGENPDDESEPDTMFVAANGTCTPLTGIGRVTGKEITGLTNYHQYRVKSAKFLTGIVSYIELGAALQTTSRDQTIIDEEGAAIFKFPDNGGYVIFTPPLTPPIGNYDIVMTPFPAAGPASPVPTISIDKDKLDILMEAAEETTVDYIFYDKINYDLFVLRVIFPPEGTEPPAGIVVNVELDFTGDNPPQTDKQSISYPQSDGDQVTINVVDASQYDEIKWYIDGEEVDSGASFTLIKDEIKYTIIGVHIIITVEAVREGIPYSKVIEVTVIP